MLALNRKRWVPIGNGMQAPQSLQRFQGGIHVPGGVCASRGCRKCKFFVPIFWPIFPGLDPGPAQGLTWPSLGLDPGQPRPAQVSPGQPRPKNWSKKCFLTNREPKVGAAAEGRCGYIYLCGGRRPPLVCVKHLNKICVFMVPDFAGTLF